MIENSAGKAGSIRVSSRSQVRLTVFFVFVLFAACVDEFREVVIFVQATNESAVNRQIMNRVKDVASELLKQEDIYLTIYPITANTAASSPLYSAAIRRGIDGELDRHRARLSFIKLRDALDSVYAPHETQLVDILGSVFVLDRAVGNRQMGLLGIGRNSLSAVYITDLVQRSGGQGWDFSAFARDSQSLEACKTALPEEYGDKLEHLARFTEIDILILRLDLEKEYRQAGLATIHAPYNFEDVKKIWQVDFFGELLNSNIMISDAEAASIAVRRFL